MELRGEQGVRTAFGRLVGAHLVFAVDATGAEVLAQAQACARHVRALEPLASLPVTCPDLKELGKKARETGEALVVLGTHVSAAALPAVRLGAHLFVEEVGETTLVALSKDAERALPGMRERLAHMPETPEEALTEVASMLEAKEHAWRASSDVAQVVASYLSCHPKVACVRYPGLKSDEGFSVAARTLVGGFGPYVDYLETGHSAWKRVTCGAVDPKAKVMELEEALR